MRVITNIHTSPTLSLERKSMFARVFDTLYENRMRKAQAEIQRHSRLFPHPLDEATSRLTCRTGDQFPFLR